MPDKELGIELENARHLETDVHTERLPKSGTIFYCDNMKIDELSAVEKERIQILELLKEELDEIPNSIKTYFLARSPHDENR